MGWRRMPPPMDVLGEALRPWFYGEFTAVTSAFFWSVAVILLRLSGLRLAPIPLTFFKSVVALFCFSLTILGQGLPLLPDLPANAYPRLVLSALLGIAIADTLFVAALNRLGASLQALADCIYSPSIAAVGFLMFGEGLSAREILGGCLVLSGVMIGVDEGKTYERSPEQSRTRLLEGVLLAAGAHVIMAVGILMVRDVLRAESVVWVSGFRFFVATLALAGYGWLRGEKMLSAFRRPDLFKWTIPLSLLGPYLATIFWASGFKYTTPGRAAIYNQLSTVFIIILARLTLREHLTPRRLIGVLLAGVGSVLVAAGG